MEVVKSVDGAIFIRELILEQVILKKESREKNTLQLLAIMYGLDLVLRFMVILS